MKIQKVTDPAFRRYGKVLEGYNFGPLLKEMKHTPVPEDVVYVPSAEELEALDVEKELKNRAFGGLPVQIGYCIRTVWNAGSSAAPYWSQCI